MKIFQVDGFGDSLLGTTTRLFVDWPRHQKWPGEWTTINCFKPNGYSGTCRLVALECRTWYSLLQPTCFWYQWTMSIEISSSFEAIDMPMHKKQIVSRCFKLHPRQDWVTPLAKLRRTLCHGKAGSAWLVGLCRGIFPHIISYMSRLISIWLFFLSGIVRYDVDNDSKWIHHFIVTRLELQLYGLWMFKFYLNPFKSMWNPCSTPTLLDPNVLLRLGSLPRRWRMWNSLEITMLTKTRCFCHWPVILKGLDVKPEVLL